MIQNAQKITSTFERRSNHLKKLILKYQKSVSQRNSLLLKHNIFLNNLRDSGRLTKEEIELYFKK
jgi:hypothetical protein